MAHIAHRYDYTRPDRRRLRSNRDSRWAPPGRRALAAAGRFVPNDVDLDLERERLWLVTGPNMAGKTTLLRQVALSVILAQMGSFVPARAARIGVVDRVLSRVGASDNLARGESTFMVEMRETAEILRHATRRSLVIFDEIGRGTSTFDGLSIAWAVAEYLHDAIGCRALFATHYHELTALGEGSRSRRELQRDRARAERRRRVLASLGGRRREPQLRHRGGQARGPAGDGAGSSARAARDLGRRQRGARRAQGPRKSRGNTDQLPLFGARSAETRGQTEVLETLRALDLDRVTGLEALQFLARLKQKL